MTRRARLGVQSLELPPQPADAIALNAIELRRLLAGGHLAPAF
jgi:hypothetical protein